MQSDKTVLKDKMLEDKLIEENVDHDVNSEEHNQ